MGRFTKGKKHLISHAVFASISLVPLAVLATTGGDTLVLMTPEQRQVADIFKWIIGITLVGQGFWVRKYMQDNDKRHESNEKSNEKQWEAISRMTELLYKLHGEHQANQQSYQRRRDDST